jgi:hypothetical protein
MMIKRCILYILEHGSVPAVALALAIAPTNSRSRQRDHLTEPTKPVTKIGLSEPREDSMTLVTKDCELGANEEEPTFGLRLEIRVATPEDLHSSSSVRVGICNKGNFWAFGPDARE